MAYEELKSVAIVKLGGTDKKTGKPNPDRVEGYFLRVENWASKYGTSPVYVFLTETGEVGVFGSAGITFEMKKAKPGLMTLLINTGKTKPSNKGNDTVIYKALQDSSLSINVDEHNPAAVPTIDVTTTTEEPETDESDEAESYVAAAAPRPAARQTTAAISEDRRSKVLAALGARK